MSMAEVVMKGYMNAPAEGSTGAFYGNQFVFSHVDWLLKYGQVRTHAMNNNPVLTTKKVIKGSFVYLYEINVHGQWESKYYTTRTIAAGPVVKPSHTMKEISDLCDIGIAKAPKVAGSITGNFHPHQYKKSKEEWEKVTKIALAYIDNANIATMQFNNYVYWYYIDPETNFWHSLFFTSLTEVLGEE